MYFRLKLKFIPLPFFLHLTSWSRMILFYYLLDPISSWAYILTVVVEYVPSGNQCLQVTHRGVFPLELTQQPSPENVGATFILDEKGDLEHS